MKIYTRPPHAVILLLTVFLAQAQAQPTRPPAPETPLRHELPPEVAATRPTLERLLLQNILPFWHPAGIDREHGGYLLNHDPKGQWKGPADKAIVTQSRTVWFFSRLMRSPYAKPEYLEAARHGFRFLRDRMWDREHGGFYWSVDSRGEKPATPVKHLYGQAFGLYALSEYARVSGDPEAEALARDLARLLEERAHDRVYGGYLEWFQRDWTPADEGTPRVMGQPAPDSKLMNTHLHLMEAFTAYVDLTHDPCARERLLELIAIQTSAVVRKTVGACTDKYRRDWTPLTGAPYDIVSYGHDIENVWLVIDACRAAGISTGPHRDLFKTLFDYSLRYGYDSKDGGFYDAGPFGAPATRRDKVWWVQAEGLVAALTMAAFTGDKEYADCYLRTLAWTTSRQVDSEAGEWHEVLRPDGTVRGSKAHAWKGPYHNGRAVLQCLELLSR